VDIANEKQIEFASESNNMELEYKYRADNVLYSKFKNMCQGALKGKSGASWDYYYENSDGAFIRFRDSDVPELTLKRKTTETNSWSRLEIDIPLDISRLDFKSVDYFLKLNGFKKAFSIYKTYFIYWFENVNYCYYITYDENMNELDRFVEVEVNKSKVSELNATNTPATTVLKEAEALLKEIGLSPNNRMRRSLYEIYKEKL
jgi:adenylate cyclase class IV